MTSHGTGNSCRLWVCFFEKVPQIFDSLLLEGTFLIHSSHGFGDQNGDVIKRGGGTREIAADPF